MDAEPTRMSPYQQRLAANIDFLLEYCGLSLKRVAGMADLARATVYNWTVGIAQPTLGNLESVAEALGVEPGHLLMDPADLRSGIETGAIELRPFVLPRPASPSSSSSTATASGEPHVSRLSSRPSGRLPNQPKRSWLHSGAAA